MPNSTLTKKTIRIDKDAVRALDVSALEEQSINPNDWLTAGQSEYRLYAWLSSQFENTTILDVGTRTGGSALALSYYDKNQVISYDLVEQGASSAIKKENITFKIQDFREDETLDWDNISIIMIDVDPHDGVQEVEMMEFLNEKGWKGIMLLDDIGPGWPEVQDMWDAIEEPKIDVTPVGHMSGTGLVNFGSKHDIDWA